MGFSPSKVSDLLILLFEKLPVSMHAPVWVYMGLGDSALDLEVIQWHLVRSA